MPVLTFECDYCKTESALDFDEIVPKNGGPVKSACAECTWDIPTNTCDVCGEFFEVEKCSIITVCANCKRKGGYYV